MKFSTKLTLGCVSLLAGAICAVGLILTGASFASGLEQARSEGQAQQNAAAAAVTRSILADEAFCGSTEGRRGTAMATAAQTYAAQTGMQLALWSGGQYALYSSLPAALTQAEQQQAIRGGAEQWQLVQSGGERYLLFSLPLSIPGSQADLVCAYDAAELFAARDAQLRVWLLAALALLAAGGGAAALFSRAVTGPLAALQAASASIAAGGYTARTGLQSGDEIGALSRSFDAMADAVEWEIAARDETVRRQKEFIAAFTHEVRTPMTAMLGYANLMRAHSADAGLQREAGTYIYHETKRLGDLSDRLMALMELEEVGSQQREPVQARALMTQALRSLPQDAAPVPRMEAEDCTVLADRGLWADLLRNLLLNAQNACRGKEGATVTLRCERKDGKAVFSVSDTGCGIPAESLPRVTEAFYRVDPARSRADGGSGIGLALCGRIAAAHGTELQIESMVGKGTTVRAALPEYLPEQEEHHEN